ncbi:ricin-type beta-trefoil lectin domain protein [Dactylosporangium sp. CA-092794]|uniref:RICIN domain-containing protein n=1 Tax=Dactylosporangium sp. CA-092794 TaxID=3239929 RepID=UPI003D941AF4
MPPTASAAVPVLPEPFTPAKPTIPQIPRQRRPDGPTAVATAAIPAAGTGTVLEDDDDPDAPDPATVGTLGGAARADLAETAEMQNLEFIVTLPGTDVTNDPDVAPAAEPEPEAVSDAAAEEPAPPAADPAQTAEMEVVDGELMPAGPTVPADDSPTVADYPAPALAIVAEDDDEDGAYRGSRRKGAPWRRYPMGAVAVAVLILLVTGAVSFQLVNSGGSGGGRDNALPASVPGVNLSDMPEPVGGAAADPSPEEEWTPGVTVANPGGPRSHPASALPPSASTSLAASADVPGAPTPTSVATTAAPPPPGQPVTTAHFSLYSFQPRYKKCLEYRSGQGNQTVIDNCDTNTNQVWKIHGDATKGATITADNGYCLDVQNAGTGNGNAVWIFPCNNSVAQTFVRRSDGRWQNPHAGRCLTAANNGTGAGTQIVIWDCSNNLISQLWSVA